MFIYYFHHHHIHNSIYHSRYQKRTIESIYLNLYDFFFGIMIYRLYSCMRMIFVYVCKCVWFDFVLNVFSCSCVCVMCMSVYRMITWKYMLCFFLSFIEKLILIFVCVCWFIVFISIKSFQKKNRNWIKLQMKTSFLAQSILLFCNYPHYIQWIIVAFFLKKNFFLIFSKVIKLTRSKIPFSKCFDTKQQKKRN